MELIEAPVTRCPAIDDSIVFTRMHIVHSYMVVVKFRPNQIGRIYVSLVDHCIEETKTIYRLFGMTGRDCTAPPTPY